MRYLAEHTTANKRSFLFVSARAEGLQFRSEVDVAVSDSSRDACVIIILGVGYCLLLIRRLSYNGRLSLV